MISKGYKPVQPWDITTARYEKVNILDAFEQTVPSLSVSGVQSFTTDVFAKETNTEKIFVLGQTPSAIHAYDVTDLATSYLDPPSGTYSLSGLTNAPSSFYFKSDGLVMFLLDSGQELHEFSLSTAWDVATLSFVRTISTAASSEGDLWGLQFRPDGTAFYFTGTQSNAVWEFHLSTAWDITTASYIQNFNINAQETQATGLAFSSDGAVMFVSGISNDSIWRYNLSVPWDVSSAVVDQSVNVEAQEFQPMGMYLTEDGARLFQVGFIYDNIEIYNMTSAVHIDPDSPTAQGVVLSNDGTKMVITNPNLEFYTLSTPWDLLTATNSGGSAYSNVDNQNTSFKPDGLQHYVAAHDGNVRTYTSGTAFTAGTLTRITSFGGDSIHTIQWNSDGTRCYVGFGGSPTYGIKEYNCSTAYNTATATYSREIYLGSIEAVILSFVIKPDGTKLYIQGQGRVQELDFGTPWDITTLSYLQKFTFPYDDYKGIYISPDGLRLFVVRGKTLTEYFVDRFDLGP